MDIESELKKADSILKLRRPQRVRHRGLDSEVDRFLRHAGRPAKRNVSVPKVFEQLIGDELAENCRIESITSGVLKISVLPGAYMFRLSSLANNIVETLSRQCPSAKIRQIKLVPLK